MKLGKYLLDWPSLSTPQPIFNLIYRRQVSILIAHAQLVVWCHVAELYIPSPCYLDLECSQAALCLIADSSTFVELLAIGVEFQKWLVKSNVAIFEKHSSMCDHAEHVLDRPARSEYRYLVRLVVHLDALCERSCGLVDFALDSTEERVRKLLVLCIDHFLVVVPEACRECIVVVARAENLMQWENHVELLLFVFDDLFTLCSDLSFHLLDLRTQVLDIGVFQGVINFQARNASACPLIHLFVMIR
jgi:hypothetical protein